MTTSNSLGLGVCLFSALVTPPSGQDGAGDPTRAKQEDAAASKAFLSSLAGSWEGSCRTWFHPGQLADESKVTGEFQFLLGGRFLRHTYQGRIHGKPRTGEETIVFNSARQKFQTVWIDDFHMNYGILFSEGDRTKSGFAVTGKYAVGPDQPRWGWKTVFELVDDNHLTITAYNVSPDGGETKAVQTVYTRRKR